MTQKMIAARSTDMPTMADTAEPASIPLCLHASVLPWRELEARGTEP